MFTLTGAQIEIITTLLRCLSVDLKTRRQLTSWSFINQIILCYRLTNESLIISDFYSEDLNFNIVKCGRNTLLSRQ